MLLAGVALAGCASGQATPATDVTDTGATLNGNVTSAVNGTASYWFVYGKTPSYGSETSHQTISISDRNPHPVSASVTGLDAGTQYHYELCAQYPGFSPSCGTDQMLTTAEAVHLSISATPALFPGFDPKVSDYVVRCDGQNPMTVELDRAVRYAGLYRRSAGAEWPIHANRSVATNQGFSFSTTANGQTNTYHARCLPSDFPNWTVSGAGDPSQDWILVTLNAGLSLTHYAAFFDNDGVPVWWYPSKAVQPLDATLLSNNTVAFAHFEGTGFNVQASEVSEIRRLDGTLVKTVSTVGSPTDFHELQPLPNGDFLLDTYTPRDHVDLSPYGGPADATVVDGQIQEIAPDGSLVWSWNSKDHIDLSETGRWWPSILSSPTTLPDGRKAYDIVHLNAIEPDGDSLLVSFRHLDAIYRINRSDGGIQWKLGGTTTPESLTVSGDNQSVHLGGQHDVRRLADGTVSVHDNGTNLGRAPRVLRFQIDPTAKTATVVEKLSDSEISSSICCGSARQLPSGGWLVSWGGNPTDAEYGPDGSRIFKLQFLNTSPFLYRAVPVPHGQLSADDLRQGMDTMFPR